ncbi:hypothetical protein H4219_002935 [Mycoemilia scoparia]|uniref:[histone H3]-lysine(36) N-trimethyltransferase n=1 Tax=Mycoemilia scoparia TaxID=417184 RepID=A0A9W8A478_9FUNG|nr:hypothetical protein H4219_002935 [Mycoemilia scoparia]
MIEPSETIQNSDNRNGLENHTENEETKNTADSDTEKSPSPTTKTIGTNGHGEPPESTKAEKETQNSNAVDNDLKGTDMTEIARQKFAIIDHNEFVGVSPDDIECEESFPCNCQYTDGTDDRSMACGEASDCINRLIQMECNPLTCPTGSYCLNRRFQKKQYAKIRVIDAGLKGYGVQALESLSSGRFVMEYLGEVVTSNQFLKRSREYEKVGIIHHYCMSIGYNMVIDATERGCLARYINHSCEPNCVLQKWMVGGQVRMGIFAKNSIKRGDELTFDYKFERLPGTEPQKCLCGAPSCKGVIGVTKESAHPSDSEDDDGDAELEDEMEDGDVTVRQKAKLRNRSMEDDMEDEYVDPEYEETRFEVRPRRKKGLFSDEQVLKFVQIMMRSSRNPKIMRLLMKKLMETEDKKLLTSFVSMRGLSILRTWLAEYKDDEVMVIEILQCISSIPIRTRNTVEENKVTEPISALSESKDEVISSLAKKLLDRWGNLKRVYKIPKKQRPAAKNSDTEKRDGSGSSMSPEIKQGDDNTYPAPQSYPYNRKPSGSWSPDRSRDRKRSLSSASRSRSRSKSRYDSPYRSPHESYPQRPYNDYGYRGYNKRFAHSGGRYGYNRPPHRYGPDAYYSREQQFPRSQSWQAQEPPPNHTTVTNSPASSNTSLQQLPPGWKMTTTDTGLVYYYNEETRTTQWEPPSVLSNDSSCFTNAPTSSTFSEPSQTPPLSSTRPNSTGPNSAATFNRPSSARYQDDKSYPRPSHSADLPPGSIDNASSNTAPTTNNDTLINGIPKARIDEMIRRTMEEAELQLQQKKEEEEKRDLSQIRSKSHNTSSSSVRRSSKRKSSGSGNKSDAENQASSKSLKNSNSASMSKKNEASSAEALEKRAKSQLAEFVVKHFSNYKADIPHDKFKHEARKVTNILMEKEHKSASYSPEKLINMDSNKKGKIKEFIKSYVQKLLSR